MDSLSLLLLTAVCVMPIYEFKSPDGVSYYGQGASPEEAFRTAEERSPHEIAAMRTRQSVVHGAPEPEFDEPEAARAVHEGDYGPLRESAFESGKALFGAAAPMASAVGSAIAPTATAEESKFPFIADAQERKAADLAFQNIKEYSTDPKTGRKVFDKEATSKKRNEFFLDQQKLARTRGEETAAQTDWEEKQRPAVEKLSPDERQIYESITVPGNPGQTRAQKAAFLQEVGEQRKQLTMTWAEKNQGAMEALQLGAAGISGVAPIYQAWRRALGLTKTAKEAERAFENAIKSRAPKSAKDTMAMKANLAESLDQINDPGFLKAIAKSALIGGLVSAGASQAPNFVDWARLPEGSEAKNKAMHAALNPENYGRSGLEGALGAGFGRGIAEKFGTLPTARARNASILRTIREKQAADDLAAQNRARAAAEKRAPAANTRPKPRIRAVTEKRADPMKRSDLDPLSGGYGDPLA